MEKTKRNIKISTMVFILIILLAILLVILAFQSNPNKEIITIFSDIMKLLAGALVGAIAGERK